MPGIKNFGTCEYLQSACDVIALTLHVSLGRPSRCRPAFGHARHSPDAPEKPRLRVGDCTSDGSVWLMLYTLVRADPLHRDLDQLPDLLVQAGEQVTGEV